MDAVCDVNLAAFDPQFIGAEILAQHVVQHRLHLLFGQQVDRRGGEQVAVVVDEDAYLRAALVEKPRVVAVACQHRVDPHLFDGRFDEPAQRRLFAFFEDAFGQLVAARRAILLFLGDQLLAAAALHLEYRAVEVADRIQQCVQRLDPDAEAHVVGLRELAHRHAHHPVVFVEDRAARVARVHRGVGLDVVFAVHQLLGR